MPFQRERIKSTFKEEVALWGEAKGKIIVLGEVKLALDGSKHPKKCKWFKFVNFVNLFLI